MPSSSSSGCALTPSHCEVHLAVSTEHVHANNKLDVSIVVQDAVSLSFSFFFSAIWRLGYTQNLLPIVNRRPELAVARSSVPYSGAECGSDAVHHGSCVVRESSVPRCRLTGLAS
ncbi:hypothetical protein EXIGLDRAFT_716715 [Exidia glandulosa HHB12029]|uniref:Uncharacterized protein n=1 Tax=Exidia glandulosa HHB12029 TaxID=1314781 RepID=A0A165Z0Y0_EXIGL|nr:hypothetical protein EXIGLDRAFT_716715 [Exidia glandulosa HHB12029]